MSIHFTVHKMRTPAASFSNKSGHRRGSLDEKKINYLDLRRHSRLHSVQTEKEPTVFLFLNLWHLRYRARSAERLKLSCGKDSPFSAPPSAGTGSNWLLGSRSVRSSSRLHVVAHHFGALAVLPTRTKVHPEPKFTKDDEVSHYRRKSKTRKLEKHELTWLSFDASASAALCVVRAACSCRMHCSQSVRASHSRIVGEFQNDSH